MQNPKQQGSNLAQIIQVFLNNINNNVFYGIVIAVLLLGIAYLVNQFTSSRPQCSVVVSDITAERSVLGIKEKIKVAVRVDNPNGLALEYNWQAVNGAMNPNVRTNSPESIYETPSTPVNDTISVDITAPGCQQVRRSTQVSVILGSANDTLPLADIVIAQFDGSNSSNPIEISRRLETNLQDKLAEYNMVDTTVEAVPYTVKSKADAQEIATKTQSQVVIWGWYDSFGIEIRIQTFNPILTGADLLSIRELPLEIAGENTTEIALTVKNVLPENASFVSLFAIGRLHYLQGSYQEGYKAFDAAMNSIPNDVAVKDEALLRFFNARLLSRDTDKDLTTAICEYVNAINLRPDFAEAYNNLGFLLTDHRYSNVRDEVTSCLAEIHAIDDPSYLFSRAHELQPNSLIIQYNYLAMQWLYVNDEAVRAKVERDLRVMENQEFNFSGLYIILGNISFRDGMYEEAVRYYDKALKINPQLFTVRYNKGQALILFGDIAHAREELTSVLENDEVRETALLSLAQIELSQGNYEGAKTYLEDILSSSRVGIMTVEAYASILMSWIYFREGDVDSAINYMTPTSALNNLGEHNYYYDDDDAKRQITAIENYIIGLLYLYSGKEQEAAHFWPKDDSVYHLASIVPDEEHFEFNATTQNAWQQLVTMCIGPIPDDYNYDEEGAREVDVSSWGAVNNCLPLDIDERINSLYGFVFSQIPHRHYFQRHIVGELACPYLFVWDLDEQQWNFRGVVLKDIDSYEKKARHVTQIWSFSGLLKISEMEPETSYIDSVEVIIEDFSGNKRTLLAPIAAITKSDNLYLTLNQGEEIIMDFHLDVKVRRAWVVTEGYYVPKR